MGLRNFLLQNGFGSATWRAKVSKAGGLSIEAGDSPSIDAFGRWRVSEAFNTFDMQFNTDLQPLFFEQGVTGTGSVTHLPAISAAELSTGGTVSGDGVIFQTYEYFRYQPGKSNFIPWTCILGAKVANVRKRIGYFDGENGFFFEQDASNMKVVRRTKTSGSVVDNATNQSAWNLDTLDGSGDAGNPSGITLDESKDNIFAIDFQALYAGRIRYGFDFGGHVTYVHEEKYANTAIVPFVTNANLPFRAEIFNTATASGTTTFDLTCLAIMSEGGLTPMGVPGSASSTALRQVTTGNEPLPIISIRPRTTFNSITNRGQVKPLGYSITSEDATVRYEIIRNGVLTGASFANVNTAESLVMVDVAATAITGGLVIDSGFLTGAKDNKESGNTNELLLSKLALYNDLAGTTTDILTIAISIINSGDTSSDCGGCFSWKELR
jgi:hypothetical protein